MNLKDINGILAFAIKDKKPDLVITIPVFIRLIHVSQLKHFKRKIGLPEEYAPGRPIPRQAYEISKMNSIDLAPFKVVMGNNSMPLKINAYGNALIPSDFYFPSSARYQWVRSQILVSWQEVEILDDKTFNKRITSSLMAPSRKHPVANVQNGAIQFVPKDLKFVNFTYLRVPPEPVYGVKYDRGFAESVPATSTELLWSDTNVIDICAIALFDLGIIMNKQEIASYANKVEQTGI